MYLASIIYLTAQNLLGMFLHAIISMNKIDKPMKLESILENAKKYQTKACAVLKSPAGERALNLAIENGEEE